MSNKRCLFHGLSLIASAAFRPKLGQGWHRLNFALISFCQTWRRRRRSPAASLIAKRKRAAFLSDSIFRAGYPQTLTRGAEGTISPAAFDNCSPLEMRLLRHHRFSEAILATPRRIIGSDSASIHATSSPLHYREGKNFAPDLHTQICTITLRTKP